MQVTMDKYELPVAIADSAAELARMVGVKPNTVLKSIYYSKKHGWKSRYKKIEITEDE